MIEKFRVERLIEDNEHSGEWELTEYDVEVMMSPDLVERLGWDGLCQALVERLLFVAMHDERLIGATLRVHRETDSLADEWDKYVESKDQKPLSSLHISKQRA